MKINQFVIPCIAATISLAGNSSVAEDSAMEIAKKHETAKAEALDAYLAANPEADDRDEAFNYLISSRMFIEDFGAVAKLLSKRYETFEKGAEANVEMLVGQVVRPLFEAYRLSGQKEEAGKLITRAREDLASHPAAPQISQFFDGLEAQLKRPVVGDTMEIKFTDIKGNEVDLAAMTESGKVVLVDFWATWCAPCLQEFPDVIAAHQEYKDKGFAVIGISLDDAQTDVKGFLEANPALDWPQHYDGQGWQNEISTQFGITSIPATFLIGKDGKVVATDLHGNQLANELAKLFP